MSGVSVIIPCFDHGAFLPEAIESVRNQIRPAEEIIVVDDGSRDPKTCSIMEDLERKGEIHLCRQENRGPAAARNTGINRATQSLIVCLDADDRLREDFLSSTVPILTQDEMVGIAYGRAGFFGVESGESRLPPFRFPEFLLDPTIYATALFRKRDWAAVGGFCEEMREGWEDFEFWVSLVERGCEVRFVDRVLFDYRKQEISRDSGFTRSRDKVLSAFEMIFHRHRDLYSENIRLLFEAHLERLDLRSILPSGGRAELRFTSAGKEIAVQSDEVVPAEGEAELSFRLEGSRPDHGEFRLDPFEGPGDFELVSVFFGDGSGESGLKQPEILDHSLGLRSDPQESGSIFFVGPDPQIRFRGMEVPALQEKGRLVFRVRVRRGPSVAGDFLAGLSRVGARFDLLRERSRGLELELEHVKGELAKEMEKRREVQRSRGYRWTRWLSRLAGKQRKRSR